MGLQIGGCNEYELALFFFTLPFSIISGNISDTISFALLLALTLTLSLILAGSLLFFSLEHSFIFSRSLAHSFSCSASFQSLSIINYGQYPKISGVGIRTSIFCAILTFNADLIHIIEWYCFQLRTLHF